MGNVKLEVCVESLRSALAAVAGGASRIELCDCLAVGGTTPSLGLIETVRRQVSIPIHVLIRPRAADFCYAEEELLVMERDIAIAKAASVDGIVCGVLNPNGTVNMSVMERLVSLARPLTVTFHRAFDMTENPSQALEDLISLGVDYVLTSGQQSDALKGLDLLTQLSRQANGRIRLMPGGGITEQNVASIVKATGVDYVHASARSSFDSLMQYRKAGLNMGALPEDEYRYGYTNPERVKAIIIAANTD